MVISNNSELLVFLVKFCFFVDADVAIAPDTINRVRLAFTQDTSLAAVIGSYDDTPVASNFLSQYKNLFHHYTHQNANEDAFTFWGSCAAIRRDIFLACYWVFALSRVINSDRTDMILTFS
ncbi:hypothetical protein [Anabaena azotica]|uniref:hypothetical protein n=1 Tax=Anabaena azotica TaxID=197653 RepID=UPI0039A58682